MAQVMVNFRLDEDVKKDMEQACKEMGLTMTTAFTIFAKKVGKEKRIPFEITARSQDSEPYRRQPLRSPAQGGGTEASSLARTQEQLEQLCADVRRALTSIHTAIPSSITGLSMERIRLLCGDELKDKAAGAASAVKALFSSRNAGLLNQRDSAILDEYASGLSSIAGELGDMEHTLIPAMKARQGGDADEFAPYEQRLAAVSRKFDDLGAVMQRFLRSTASTGGARAVAARIQQAASAVGTAYVLSALDSLDALIVRQYDLLDAQTQTRLESDYLQTLELTLRELAQAEQDGGDVSAKAALCLRVVNVLSQAISDSSRTRQEWNARSLEAEVAALERLAAMRGDVGGGMSPEA